MLIQFEFLTEKARGELVGRQRDVPTMVHSLLMGAIPPILAEVLAERRESRRQAHTVVGETPRYAQNAEELENLRHEVGGLRKNLLQTQILCSAGWRLDVMTMRWAHPEKPEEVKYPLEDAWKTHQRQRNAELDQQAYGRGCA